MGEAGMDALFAEIVKRLLRMRRELTHADFDELAGAMMIDLDVAEIEAAGRANPARRPNEGVATVVRFPEGADAGDRGLRPRRPFQPQSSSKDSDKSFENEDGDPLR